MIVTYYDIQIIIKIRQCTKIIQFFFFWKIICCNGHNQSTNPEQLSPYEDSDEEITTRLFSKDLYAIWS